MQCSMTKEEPVIDAEQEAKKQGVMKMAAQHDRCSMHYRYNTVQPRQIYMTVASNMIKARHRECGS